MSNNISQKIIRYVLVACLLLVSSYYFLFHIYPDLDLPWLYRNVLKNYNSTYVEMLRISNTLDEFEDIDSLTSTALELLRSSQDSFNGDSFKFVIEEDAEPCRWYLISSGPDKIFNFTERPFSWIAYDPTNGTVSKGDLVFGSHINPKRLDAGKYVSQTLGRMKGNPKENPETWKQAYGGFEYIGK